MASLRKRPGSMQRGGVLVLALVHLLPWQALQAQGQDSTPAERYLRIMAELLPGIYDNANQHYFDQRRNLPAAERHERFTITIKPVDAPAFGSVVFSWQESRGEGETRAQQERIAVLSADGADDEVRLRLWNLDNPTPGPVDYPSLRPDALKDPDGCDYWFKRRAESFRGVQRKGSCQLSYRGRSALMENVIELSERDLFLTDTLHDAASGERLAGHSGGEPFWLERARVFQCYVDVPGVGGGRDEPFVRYEPIEIHDKGGRHWFQTTGEPSKELGIALQSVTWHVLNEAGGNFNRNSLVVYVMEKGPDGTVKDHGYAFTEPDAERIGVNLKWMLVNCSLVPPAEAKPEL